MNCQPGDLAIVIADRRYRGRLLEILHARPARGTMYTLPDGTQAEVTSDGPGWVVRMLEPMPVVWTDGVMRMAIYGDCPDAYLKPLRGIPDAFGTDETVTAYSVAACSGWEKP